LLNPALIDWNPYRHIASQGRGWVLKELSRLLVSREVMHSNGVPVGSRISFPLLSWFLYSLENGYINITRWETSLESSGDERGIFHVT
jgi:hypothetical protein